MANQNIEKIDEEPRREFRKYTNLSVLIHILQTRSIALVDPNSWDDGNDKHYMSAYKERAGAEFVFANCFAESAETYHHWRIFSNGESGVCIEFDKEKLISNFDSDPNIVHRKVDYHYIDDLRQNGKIAIADLPFLKRMPYAPENEYRAVTTVTNCSTKRVYNHSIKIGFIRRITLSPWMPYPLRASIRTTLKSIQDCRNLEIVRSTLVGNTEWKNLAGAGNLKASK